MADPSPAPSFSAALPTRSANLRFGRFELQTDEQRLLVDGQPAPLRARTLTLLLALAQRAGSLVTRQELLDLVWPGLVVEENNLSVQINALRKVLGSEIVVTIPGPGLPFQTAGIGASSAADERAKTGNTESHPLATGAAAADRPRGRTGPTRAPT